jgi:hypothetical protein
MFYNINDVFHKMIGPLIGSRIATRQNSKKNVKICLIKFQKLGDFGFRILFKKLYFALQI